jgi:hypothetical protein
MWLEIIYKPTSLFSLKLSGSTNSAGKSLPCPSPYAVKMALLNAIITYDSLETAQKNFNLIRDLDLFFSLPEFFVINNCMIRILKDNDKVSKDLKTVKPFKSTVAFREYVYLSNAIHIAIDTSNNSDEEIQFLRKWFVQINYFGKKGCFFQFSDYIVKESLSNEYVKIFDKSFQPGIMFAMDDVDKKSEFKNMDNYNSVAKAKRAEKIYIFPYRQVEANKNYTFFKHY